MKPTESEYDGLEDVDEFSEQELEPCDNCGNMFPWTEFTTCGRCGVALCDACNTGEYGNACVLCHGVPGFRIPEGSEYEGLEDVDEFEEEDSDIDECDNCHRQIHLDDDNWEQCQCDALWCNSCLDHYDMHQRFTWALKQDSGMMYEVMAVCPHCQGRVPPNQGLQESDEYEGLEDVDEFEDAETSVCEGCGQVFPLDAIDYYCSGCHGAWCDRCYDENEDKMKLSPIGEISYCPMCDSGALLWR
jgi:hypothetical protein